MHMGVPLMVSCSSLKQVPAAASGVGVQLRPVSSGLLLPLPPQESPSRAIRPHTRAEKVGREAKGVVMKYLWLSITKGQYGPVPMDAGP